MATELGVKRAFRTLNDCGFRQPPDADRLMRGWVRRLERFTDDQVVGAAERYADDDNSVWPKPGQLIARYLASQALRVTPREEYDATVDPIVIPPKWEKRVIWRMCGATICPQTGVACTQCESCETFAWSEVPAGEMRMHHRWLEGMDWSDHQSVAPWMAGRIRAHYDLMGVALSPEQDRTLRRITDDSMPAEPATTGARFV